MTWSSVVENHEKSSETIKCLYDLKGDTLPMGPKPASPECRSLPGSRRFASFVDRTVEPSAVSFMVCFCHLPCCFGSVE